MIIKIDDPNSELSLLNTAIKDTAHKVNDTYKVAYHKNMYNIAKSERYPFVAHMGIGRIRTQSIKNHSKEIDHIESLLGNIKMKIKQEARKMIKEALPGAKHMLPFTIFGVLDLKKQTYIKKWGNEMSNAKTWLSEIKTSGKKHGTFIAKDKTDAPISLSWFKAHGLTPEYAQAMKDMWEVTRDAYVPVEKKFLQKYPDEATKYFDGFKKAIPGIEKKLESLNTLDEKIELVLHEIAVIDPTTPLAAIMADQLNIFVSVKDMRTQQPLGYVTFLIMPHDKRGDVKATYLAVTPTAQGRGLATLLMGAIFKIVPSIKRIYLSTRVTNDAAQAAYKKWGFTQDLHPILWPGENPEHWTYFEYLADQADLLQNSI